MPRFANAGPLAVYWIDRAFRAVSKRIRPMNVSLTNDLHNFVRQKVESGEFPSEEAVLQEAVRRFRQADQNGDHGDTPEKATLPELIDWEAIESCAREVEGKNIPSIEEVRRLLAKIPGSMARAVIDEREERF
jgi:Arc/MetJ-type ribon-helix-helix transcriptional regulator